MHFAVLSPCLCFTVKTLVIRLFQILAYDLLSSLPEYCTFCEKDSALELYGRPIIALELQVKFTYYTLLSLDFGTLDLETLNSQFWIILIAGLVYHLLELREKIPSTCGLSYALRSSNRKKHKHQTFVIRHEWGLNIPGGSKNTTEQFSIKALNIQLYDTVAIAIIQYIIFS